MSLREFLKGIADAIRTVEGSTGDIPAPTYRERILALSGGGGGPFCTMSLTVGDDNIVNIDAGGISADVSADVLGSLPSGISYYYNHEQLPEIPDDIVNGYPYILIMRTLTTTRIYASKNKPYFYTTDDGTNKVTIPSGEYIRCTYNSTANAWVIDASGTSTSFSVNGNGNWAIWWSNFDVPNGSADATDVYFPASTPKTSTPSDAAYYYYNGALALAFPSSISLDNYPYVVVVRSISNGKLWAYGFPKQPYGSSSSTRLSFSGGRIRCSFEEDAGEWSATNATTTNSYLALGTTWEIVWSNLDIPNGSATATDILFYGTLAVPDPE